MIPPVYETIHHVSSLSGMDLVSFSEGLLKGLIR